MREFREVDPRTLHLPPSRAAGADPAKLQRQIAQYGRGITGMPPIWASRGKDAELMIMDGVTRATRVAKLLPGTRVTARSSVTCRRIVVNCQPLEKGCHDRPDTP